jgi:hypothetical protein
MVSELFEWACGDILSEAIDTIGEAFDAAEKRVTLAKKGKVA